MVDDQSSDSKTEITPEDVFEHHREDAIHTGAKLGLSLLPLASEIFELLIAAPASKRRDELLLSVYEGLKRLEDKFEDFSIEKLAENETFQSTVIQATQAAIRTHQKEKHEALRNAILNSALPNSPDDTLQELFIQLVNELTVEHIRFLRFVENSRIQVNSVNIPSGGTEVYPIYGTSENMLDNLIESAYTESGQQIDLPVLIGEDLYRRGLITAPYFRRVPTKARLDTPRLTLLAEEFLEFLKSPLDD